MRKALITFTVLLLVVLVFAVKSEASSTVMSDDFTSYSNNEYITAPADPVSPFADWYDFYNFPDEGRSAAANPSSKWEMDTGTFVAKTDSSGHTWGYLSNADLFRLNTQASSTDAVVSLRYKVASTANTASDVWLRYQTQYWLYAVQFDRGDNCIVAKKKLPTNTSGAAQWGGVGAGHSEEIANKGIYYVLRLDSDTPTHSGGPCNNDGLTWTQLSTSTITHDATLNAGHTYNFKATITTVPHGTGTCDVAFDCTQLQLFRGGVLVASWTDKNDGLNFDSTRTQQQDCDAGWFTTVDGYQASWCLPIYASGKSGIRNDDAVDTWIDSFSMVDAATSPPPTPTSSGTTIRGGVTFRAGTTFN